MTGFDNHPCFSETARHRTGRIHLPVAENCNIQCNFCNRKYDCVNESRPGVTSAVLSPFEAAAYLDEALEKLESKNPVSVIGIAGPGDPFANAEETLATLKLVREKYPEKMLCLATNGLNLAPYAGKIASLNVSHVTITVNTVNPETGAKIYPWVRFGPKVHRGIDGAKVLCEKQAEAIAALKAHTITVKINTVIIPGINDKEAAEVAERAASLGANVQNCIPLMHVEGTAFADRTRPDAEMMEKIRAEAGKYITQMSHCARCRADAAGLLGENNAREFESLLASAKQPGPTRAKPYLAVGSMEGLFVNRHLGEAAQFWVFGEKGGKPELIEQRPTPVPGTGDERWFKMAGDFSDCFAILCANCGSNPKKILESKGIKVLCGEGLISDIAAPLFRGKGVDRIYLANRCGKGAGCSGSGMGCGA